MNLAEELRTGLQEFHVSGRIEIRENGGRVTPEPPWSWEVRGTGEKPLLHIWADNCNITRRVLAITEQSEDCLGLSVERFGRPRPERMEMVRVNLERGRKEVSREGFCEAMRRILAEQFPDETVEKISIAADLEHSISRIYVRGISRRGVTRCAFLAVPTGETADAVDSSVTFALLWLERARQTSQGKTISFLRLIVPAGKSASLAYRIGALSPRLAIHVYELNASDERIERVDPCSNGNVDCWLVPRRETENLKARANGMLEPIVRQAPDAITAHAVPQEQEVVLRFHGLPFVLWKEGQVHFGHDSCWEGLTRESESRLKELVARLRRYRNPLASDTRHPLYRAQAERWMQSLLMQDVTRVDFNLDPEHVYEQVFAQAGGQHGVLDLLAVTRANRLAILELKASENPDLPLQAGDYWRRVCQHQAQGDLTRSGYFPGMELQPATPLVYLVAPALRFHPATDGILKYLSPEMEIIRVGLAESWRRELRVVMRQ